MAYKVVKYFTDLYDNNYPYDVGDTFPRQGLEVGKGRIAELSGKNNRQGCPLIEEEKTTARKRKTAAE